MEQAATTSPSLSKEDFAGILAALTEREPAQEPAWNDDGLADDVATLSYESALRAHARVKNTGDDPIAFSNGTSIASGEPEAIPCAETGKKPEFDLLEENRKCASVTVRMSKAECEQLHKRAAEAGMTISAYLRSCTFEAEALRAQVKEALAELRRANAATGGVETQDSPRPKAQRKRLGWLHWRVPGWQMPPRTAQA